MKKTLTAFAAVCALASPLAARADIIVPVQQPYSFSTSQQAIAASFTGAGGIYTSSTPTLTSGTFSPLQLDVNGNLKATITFPATQVVSGTVQAPNLATCTLLTTAATVCTAPGGGAMKHLTGAFNNSSTAQTATFNCYDNATTNTGPFVQFGALGADQILTFPPPGRTFNNGVTCIASAAPNGNGIEIYGF